MPGPSIPIILDPDARPIIAHRGASGRAPENTMRAFELALEEGADALEMDVRVSADGVPVVIHDASLARTTGVNALVAALPVERILELDAGARFSPDAGRTFPFRNQGIRVPLLAEVLDAFPWVPLIVEIKTSAASEAVRRVLEEKGAVKRSVIMSFEPAALDIFRTAPWTTGATGSDTQRLIRRALLRREPEAVTYSAFSLPERYHGFPLPIDLIARTARRMAKPVHIWAIDSPERARRLWRKGVSGIVTNYPSELRAARDSA
ncbi:MAG TPA: glycerophosphodiester phosphodiesterase family protein [Gemmatimonadaceae bacterium]|nr:glycerophosphodiester phosphodiesterase family protein [Gemmatimonadaceae bacterium]